MRDVESKFKINVETEGMEEAQEQIERLADAYDGFPAQVTIKNCRNCTFNIYPSQMRTVEVEAAAAAERIAKVKSPVIRKMVPLDHLKRCADLCISVGWTLEQFRKNMDEWEGDALDVTVTG